MRPSEPRNWGPPPRALVVAAVVVLGVTTALAVHGAFQVGVTTDEPIHVMRLRNYLDTGWYALDWDYGGDGPGGAGTNTYVYAPVAMLLLHAWSVGWGVEGWGEVATSARAYDVRHLGVVVIALVGTGAVAALGRVLLSRWRWGLVAAACLATVPMWTGNAMLNVKDVPVATGYTLVTLGLVLLVRHEPVPALHRLTRSGCLIAGLVLTLGTRPGMWSGLLAALLVAIAGIAITSSPRRTRAAVLAEMLAACGLACVALLACYPRLFASPQQALLRTADSSSSFLDGEKADRSYVPLHVLEEMPTLLLVFVLVGTAAAVTTWWTRGRTDPVPVFRVALVAVQVFALPVAAIVMDSDLYHGLRQLLFAAPGAALLAAYGMAWLCEGRVHESGLLRRAVPGVAAAALLLPVVDQVTLQPYQTTYVNLATDLVTYPFVQDGDPPGSDYWRASLPELVEGQALDHALLCKATVDKVSDIAYPFTSAAEAFSTSRSLDCRDEVHGPLAPLGLQGRLLVDDGEYDAVFVGPLPENCTQLDEVTRRRHGFRVVLTTLGRCTVDPPDLTAGGTWVDDPALGTATVGDLWLFAVAGWQQWPRTSGLTSPVSRAEIAFRPTQTCRRSGCLLVLHGAGPADLVAQVDGAAVAVSRDRLGNVRVPISAREARARNGVWLALTRRSGGLLEMRLLGVSEEAWG